MKNVVMVSPHFPPDSTAATHRLRIIAPHLEQFGWKPIIVTVDPKFYEGMLDPALAALVPADLRVERVGAIPVTWSRKFRIGDLGIRSFIPLLKHVRKICTEERVDLIFITIFPSYPALIGRYIRKRFGIPFVLDYQDPWVGEWGRSVGGGAQGRPTFKNRLSRKVAELLEPLAVHAADAITAVSDGTIEEAVSRNRVRIPYRLELPIGCEPGDFEVAESLASRDFRAEFDDGRLHMVYVGTVLPLGLGTISAFLSAIALLRKRIPDLPDRLAIHFFGSSNQRDASAPPRVIPIAERCGVSDVVTEEPCRLDYADAVAAQRSAGVVLLFGSSQRHYTASKLFPALLSRRPIVAAFHEASSVVGILRQSRPDARVVCYNDDLPIETHVEEIARAIEGAMSEPRRELLPSADISGYSGVDLALRAAAFFDSVVSANSPRLANTQSAVVLESASRR